MKTLAFARRNAQEMLRDKLNLAFGIGFPLVLLGLLSAIQARIPVPMFTIERLAPGIAVFGLSFVSLFSGMLIARDRGTSFLMRLFAAPLASGNFILGYTLPLLPLALGQSFICYLAALPLGLPFTARLLPAILLAAPAALLFIGIGLLCGSLFTDRQVGGLCGALLTNLSAWLSGTWFDFELVGGWFAGIARALPFSHAVDAGRAALAGDWAAIGPHLAWVCAWAAAVCLAAVLVFRRKMKAE